MNQRPAKLTSKASPSKDFQERELRNFIQICKELLEEEGDENAAFRFEMILDYLNEGNPITTDRKKVSNILGL